MKNALYIVALILVVVWAIVKFAYHIGSALIHILLIVAVAMIALNLIRGKRL